MNWKSCFLTAVVCVLIVLGTGCTKKYVPFSDCKTDKKPGYISFEISNTKYQMTNKFQFRITEKIFINYFEIWKLGFDNYL